MPDVATDPDAILARLTDVATPYAVRAAVTLGVPELLADGPASLGELAAATGVDADTLGRLLRYLVAHGLFGEPEPQRYALTDVSRGLIGEAGAARRAWMDLSGPGARMDAAYGGLAHALRTGGDGYSAVHGRPLWEDLADKPRLRAEFDTLMGTDTATVAHLVATEYDWTGIEHVIDVGGGAGILLTEILRARPSMRGTVVDLPRAVDTARQRFAAAGLGARAEAVGGSFFEPLPAGADAYIVSRVLTDWNDRAAHDILRNCVAAARPGGRVLIVEVLPDDSVLAPDSPYDLQMLAVVGGRLRDADQFTALAARAGATVAGVRRWDGGLTVIDCRPR
ncbi:methyltransferase [Nocardia terpenica]|uniref:SAM-dependent methyltransferase n=1 Tax=Nocardia terpenica TaxID=455432 RepID=A0A291RIR0_9NOCA|nr:methyltransferase [Nocardia terpenica]ATL67169.1 SAM-dependent methyltransferase [Nocardia terpenica]